MSSSEHADDYLVVIRIENHKLYAKYRQKDRHVIYEEIALEQITEEQARSFTTFVEEVGQSYAKVLEAIGKVLEQELTDASQDLVEGWPPPGVDPY